MKLRFSGENPVSQRNTWWLMSALLILGALLVWYFGMFSVASQVVVRWETASELETAGYNLYRSNSPDGPFTQVNAELIPAKGDQLVGARYELTDTQVVAGETYSYQLEEVTSDGKTSRQGLVSVRVQAGHPMTTWLVGALVFCALLSWIMGLHVGRRLVAAVGD